MRNFQNLIAWRKSYLLTLKIYKVSLLFPKEEMYGLISQIRRSSSSIPTNISEGCGRSSKIELQRFLTIACGSCSELQYQLILAKDLGFLQIPIYKELYDLVIEIRKMIYGLIKSLN